MGICLEIQQRLNNNKLDGMGIIVFRVGNFSNATKVFTNIKELEYCNMFDIHDMKFLQNPANHIIDICYVSIDAESG